MCPARLPSVFRERKADKRMPAFPLFASLQTDTVP